MIESFVELVEAGQDSVDHPPVPKMQKKVAQKRGRKAIGLRDFQTIATEQITNLEARMALITDQKSKQWQNMRKQVLMYKLRIKQRQQALYEKTQMKNQAQLVSSILSIVAKEVPHD